MRDQTKAYCYGLATVLLWSTVASAFKVALRYLDPAQLVLYASLTSTVVLGAIVLAQGKARQVFACSGRQYLLSLGLGLLNPFLYYLVLFEAYDRLPAQEAQPLNYTWAITLALLSVPLLGQRLARKDLAAIGVGYLGVLVISTHGNPFDLRFSDPIGVALALGSTVIWALYWICHARDRRDPVVALLLGFGFGLPAVFGYCWLASDLRVASVPGLLGAAYVGVFEMGVTFVLWLAALRHSASAAKVGVLIFLSPFLSLLFIRAVVGEEIRPSTLVGLAFIVAGLLLQQWRPRPAPRG